MRTANATHREGQTKDDVPCAGTGPDVFTRRPLHQRRTATVIARRSDADRLTLSRETGGATRRIELSSIPRREVARRPRIPVYHTRRHYTAVVVLTDNRVCCYRVRTTVQRCPFRDADSIINDQTPCFRRSQSKRANFHTIISINNLAIGRRGISIGHKSAGETWVIYAVQGVYTREAGRSKRTL